jgi:hypothetical protein
MADEAVQLDNDAVVESTTDKQTNRTFTQSDHDRLVMEALTAERKKYADYPDIKKTLETLQTEREQAELKEKTELERKDHELTKLASELEKITLTNKQYELKSKRDKVLSDPKFSKLPSVYKEAVQLTDDELVLQAEADKVLERWKADFNMTGQTFGEPAKATDKKPANVEYAETFRDRLAKRLNTRK